MITQQALETSFLNLEGRVNLFLQVSYSLCIVSLGGSGLERAEMSRASFDLRTSRGYQVHVFGNALCPWHEPLVAQVTL